MSANPPTGFSRRSPLDSVSTVIVQQSRDLIELMPLAEKMNRYMVKNSAGQPLLRIEDTSHKLKTFLLRKIPPFVFHASTAEENMMLHFLIPFRFIYREANVIDRERRPLGKIRQRFPSLRKTFLISGADGLELYRAIGQVFLRWDYTIYRNRVKIGSITNEWGGLAQEMLTDADTYRMTFPPDLEITHKYLLLGALLLIDLTYFEES